MHIAVLATVALFTQPAGNEELAVAGLLRRIQVTRINEQPVIYIEADPGVPLAALVKLELFGKFEPGLSRRAARRRYGRALYERSARRDLDHFAGYQSDVGVIEVGDEDWGSFPLLWHRRRSLYLYPRATAERAGRGSIMRDILLPHVRSMEGRYQVIVAEGFRQRVWCQFEGSALVSVNWMAWR